MLERLDGVDWAAVEHAYGPATDVPDLLRALRSPDPATREQVRHELFGTIVHQGTRYAATAAAVPFLAELALAPDTPDRHWLVILLTYAAIGYDEASLPGGIVELSQLDRTTSMPGKEHTFGPWARAAYQAVQAAVPSLLGLLDHGDVWLRRAVAHLVAWFPRWALVLLPRLRGRLAAEPDPDAKATMLVALGLLAGARGETKDAPRLARLLGDDDAVVRWAAAVALARLFPQAPPEPAVGELLGWLTREATVGRHPHILFPEPQEYALLVLRSVPALRERAAEALLERLPALPDADVLRGVWDLVELAFEADDPQLEIGFAALPSLQQRVLRALVELPALWPADGQGVPLVFPLFNYWRGLGVLGSLEELRERLWAYTGA
jgi:hypothetical protein